MPIRPNSAREALMARRAYAEALTNNIAGTTQAEADKVALIRYPDPLRRARMFCGPHGTIYQRHIDGRILLLPVTGVPVVVCDRICEIDDTLRLMYTAMRLLPTTLYDDEEDFPSDFDTVQHAISSFVRLAPRMP